MAVRPYRLFEVKSYEGELPVEPSAWHCEGRLRFPLEHWLKVVRFAAQADANGAERMERLSIAELHPHQNSRDREELLWGVEFVGDLISKIETAEPLNRPEDVAFPHPESFDWSNPPIWDDYSNEQLCAMLKALRAIMTESLRLERRYRSWAE